MITGLTSRLEEYGYTRNRTEISAAFVPCRILPPEAGACGVVEPNG
jgi:hypothetical protein